MIVEEVLIIGAHVTYAIGETTSNIEAIQGNVDSYMAEDGGSESASSGGAGGAGEEGPTVLIQNLYLHDGTVSVSVPGIIDEGIGTDLPDIHLTDIGKDGKGATPAALADHIIDAVVEATLDAVATLDLNEILKGVEDAAAEAERALDETLGDAQGAATEAGGLLDDAAAEAEKALDKLLE